MVSRLAKVIPDSRSTGPPLKRDYDRIDIVSPEWFRGSKVSAGSSSRKGFILPHGPRDSGPGDPSGKARFATAGRCRSWVPAGRLLLGCGPGR